jgi:hypothetical protein
MAQFVADGGALKPGRRFGIFLPKGCFDGPIIMVPTGMGHESSDPKTSLPPALIDIERRLQMGQSKWVLFHNFEQVRPDQPRYGTIQISWSSHCKRRAATVSGLNLDQISRLSDRETSACNSP